MVLTIKILKETKNMLEKLKGYKTYITGTVALITAVGGFFTGDLSMTQMLESVFVAIQSMNIRHAIVNK